MRTFRGIVALTLSAGAAVAMPSVSIVPSSAGTAMEVQTGVFKVVISAASDSVSVIGVNSPSLSEVDVTATTTGQSVSVGVSGVVNVGTVFRNGLSNGLFYVSGITASGSIGAITANRVGAVSGAEITGNVTVTGPSTVPSPRLVSLTATAGNITGDIVVDHGTNSAQSIGAILAEHGTLGTQTAPITISGRGAIETIRADSIYANIDTFQTTITKVKAEGDSGFAGDFVGSLSASTILSQEDWPIDVLGNLDANITFTQTLSHGIRVGKSFLAGRTISVPQNGLHPSAQIIFNDKNLNPAGQWLGTVTVGSTAISPVPDYNILPRTLGPALANDGGSVGIAAFRFHRMGSFPIQDTVLNLASLCTQCTVEPPPCVVDPNPAFARIRHYGPLELNTTIGTFTNDYVYRVEYRAPSSGTTDPDADVSDQYKVRISGAGVTVPIDSEARVVKLQRIDGNPLPLGGYKVTLLADANGITRLRSKISGATAFVPPYEYRFWIIADCNQKARELFDVNNDGVVNANDLAAWLNEPSDLNEDNAVDSTDLNRIVIGVATYGN